MAFRSPIHIAVSIWLYIALAGVVIATDCPDTWIPFNGSCYLFGTDTKLKFVEAEHFCRQHKESHLVHVDSAAENSFLKQFMRAFKPAYYWMGLTDERIEGLWRWYDTDTAPGFTDWAGHQPDNAATHEDCVEFHRDADYQWNDCPCDSLKEPLCEIRGMEPDTSIIG